ncbi:MAG: aminoglycoside phosphotransferase family protein [Actinomycetota bacterium]
METPALTGGLPSTICRWVEEAVGSGARLLSVREMPPWSVEMHEVIVEDGGGDEHRLVLRRYSDRQHLGIDPFYDPANESRALRLLEGTDVPTPRWYAADLVPAVCDVPAVLSSWVPGEPAWTPHDVDGYLGSAAEILVRIHVLTSTRPAGLPDYVPYAVGDGVDRRPPTWTSQPVLWERVLDVLAAGPPGTPTCFIHRDYHQGNTLTQDDRVSAVIDWPTAAWGPPGIDLARMRINLVEEVDPASAERFLAAYRAAGGDPADRHPYWDLLDAADFLNDNSYRNDLEGHDRARFEGWVAGVLAEL